MNLLRILFSFVCGQQHCWVLGGQQLPLCQRCTGLYVGTTIALALILLFRPRPAASLYWLHGLFMLFMLPFGFHFVSHGALMRTFTGALFAIGLVYYLALNPLTVLHAWKPATRSAILYYLALTINFVAILLWSLRHGGSAAAIVLSCLAFIGLVALTLLTAANLIFLPVTLRALRAPSAPALR
ncbi:MAG TPA: DUF2085 domain-containing protein [Terracidiphilus sp.]|nr:DUF2085 domain-containing protein [Terracidiphilus sp.]